MVFWVLSWLVVGLSALACASLFEWSGGRLAGGGKSRPHGLLDRLAGMAIGVALGLVVVSLAVLTLSSLSWPREPRAWMRSSRGAQALVHGGAIVSGWAAPVLPRGRWLSERFLESGRRRPRHAHAS